MMMGNAVLGLAVFFLAGSVLAQDAAAKEHVHVVNTFTFEVNAPMAQVAPLFAPEAERRWAGDDWNPTFLYPTPGRDVEGAVWTMPHGSSHNSVWVNTQFDVAAGRMQYVVFVGDLMTATIDVRVKAVSVARTSVAVTYARTAVNAEANEHVLELGEKDRGRGPEWKAGVEHALGMKAKR